MDTIELSIFEFGYKGYIFDFSHLINGVGKPLCKELLLKIFGVSDDHYNYTGTIELLKQISHLDIKIKYITMVFFPYLNGPLRLVWFKERYGYH